ncbi:MAG: hypothetical protein FH756_10920 [Firmicutes bacterium]|nr:hypothetical protein [Bacillota bacterium]
MKLFSMLPDNVNQKISSQTGLTICEDNETDNVISIIIRKSNQGGVTDPTPYIRNPHASIVIPIKPDETGKQFEEKAVQAGVPKDNIFYMIEGQGLSISRLTDTINSIKETLQQKNEDDLYFDINDDDFFPHEEKTTSHRVKVIAVRGFRGGVGSTTVATSLAYHYAEIGGKVAIVDLGIPQNVKFHCKVSDFNEKDKFLMAPIGYSDLYKPNKPIWEVGEELSNLVEILRKEYRWVIIDFSPLPDEEHLKAVQPDKTVVVMDSDIFQAVDPAKNMRDALFIYNKAIPDIEPDLIQSIVEDEVIIIKNDFSGCSAALADETSAYNKSEVITIAIGKLASRIEQ